MKKISVLLASVLFCTLVSANGADKPAPGSSVVVTNPEGSSLFKLHYKSTKSQKVKISLFDEIGNSLFSETVKSTNGFVRPYNFENMAHGQYTIQVEDENGKMEEKVNYESTKKIDKLVNVLKLKNEQNKYMLRISSARKDNVTINIYDKDNNLLHNETTQVDGGFAKLYDLKSFDSFTIEVTDSKGLVQSLKY